MEDWLSSRADYYEYHESKAELEYGAWLEQFPDECKSCEQFGNGCRLVEDYNLDYEEGCPLEYYFVCSECAYCKDNANTTEEIDDNFEIFCEYYQKILEKDGKPCEHFEKGD